MISGVSFIFIIHSDGRQPPPQPESEVASVVFENNKQNKQ
jgi:hypothetical protein